MRVCEGSRDNTFCYHRVATLEHRKARSRSRYVPIGVAPAALLALVTTGCGNDENIGLYGCPGPPSCLDGSTDSASDGGFTDAVSDQRIAPIYGMPNPDSGLASTDAELDVTVGDAGAD
jgi:hypothetical protein